MQLQRIILSIGKLALCGATIFAIAWAFVTLSPTGEVAETQADVWDLSIFPRSNTQMFASALMKLGHEKPRAYDVNGNKVFFSARAVNKRPEELVEEYQRAFYEEGLNEEMYGFGKKPTQAAKRLLAGEVVPLQIDRERMTMGGGVIKGSPETVAEWEAMEPSMREADFDDVFQGFRHVEGRWDPKEKRTLVTAVWSDEGFDMHRIAGTNDDGNVADEDIPVCIGCRRTIRWATDKGDLEGRVNIMVSPQDPAAVGRFYEQALSNRGWTLSGTSSGQRNSSATLYEFERGEQRINLSVHAEGRGSVVSAMVTDQK